jgi:hypothetical protein
VLIGFVGDVHGQVFHALAALATLQERLGRRLDLLVQVGDMGACPDPARLDEASVRYLEADPSQGDFGRLLRAEGELAGRLRRLRGEFSGPLHFIRGNHEDYPWLRGLPVDAAPGTAAVDPFDLLRYVPDGTVLGFGELAVAFLGGEESGGSVEDGEIDPEAHGRLMELGPGAVDLLVTHDAPYGLSTGYHGQVQGSRLIAELVGRLQPTFHVAGHYHLNGPRRYGRTTFLCLSQLVDSPIWRPEARGLQGGCLAVLDAEKGELLPVTDPWLSEFPTPFDLGSWCEDYLATDATDASG